MLLRLRPGRGVTVEDRPESRAADPAAARERYKSDLRASRRAVRVVCGADTGDAHTGLAVVVVALVVVWSFKGPGTGGPVTGVFAALYLLLVGVGRLRGHRRMNAWRWAYLVGFGSWGQMI
jgi:hypothetical protein